MPRPRRSPARVRAPSPEPPPSPTVEATTEDADVSAVLKIVEDSLNNNTIDGRNSPTNGRWTRAALRRNAMQPFLSEVRRRVRTELAMLRQRRAMGGGGAFGGRGRGRAAAAVQRVRERTQVVRQQVARNIRRKITGAEDLRIRDFVRQKLEILEEPPVVRLRDKMSFVLGVMGCFVVEAVALQAPQQFWMCYIFFMVPLLVLRAYLCAAASPLAQEEKPGALCEAGAACG